MTTSEYKHQWYLRNKEKRKEQERLRYLSKRKEIIRKCVEYRRTRLKTDSAYRLLSNLRHRIKQAIKHNYKSTKTIELLGTDINTVKHHIESLFKPGMSWDNYGFGNDKWHIDHIRPCATYDLRDPEQQRQCFHYTNLQPLWQHENLTKNDYYAIAATADLIV